MDFTILLCAKQVGVVKCTMLRRS